MDRPALPLLEVHPAIAGTDIAAEVAACVLFWQRRPLTGLLVRLVLAGAAIVAFGWSVHVVGPGAGSGPAGEGPATP